MIQIIELWQAKTLTTARMFKAFNVFNFKD